MCGMRGAAEAEAEEPVAGHCQGSRYCTYVRTIASNATCGGEILGKGFDASRRSTFDGGRTRRTALTGSPHLSRERLGSLNSSRAAMFNRHQLEHHRSLLLLLSI